MESELQMYGAESIRLLKHGSKDGVPWLSEYVISVIIDSEETQADGSEPPMLSTSAVRQVVAFLVDSDEFPSPEDLGVKIARTLLERYPFIERATVDLRTTSWELATSRTFVPESTVTFLATVEMTHDSYILESGIEGLVLSRVGEIHPDGVYRDLFARAETSPLTLWNAKLQLKWQYLELPEKFDVVFKQVRALVLDSLEVTPLPAPKRWANAAATLILDQIPILERVTLSADVREIVPVDMEKYGKENRHSLYWSAEETLGIFTVRLAR